MIIRAFAFAALMVWAPWSAMAQDSGTAVGPDSLPAWAKLLTEQAPGQVVVNTGSIKTGDVIESVPYRYRVMVRLKTDLTTKWSLLPTEAKADTVGFYAGTYDSDIGRGNLMCFFSSSGKWHYDSPHCVVLVSPATSREGDLLLVNVYSNIPLGYSEIRTRGSTPAFFTQPYELETHGVTIDHDFRLNLTVDKWTADGVYIQWRSENSRVNLVKMPKDADGQVRIATNGGVLTLAPDAKDHKLTQVTFVPDASAAAVP